MCYHRGAMRRVILCCAVCCALAGCDLLGGGTERMRHEVLKADPGFASALNKHDELADRIALLQRELALKKSTIDRQIEQLRKEYRDTKDQVQRKIVETGTTLKPDQQKIDLAIVMAGEELTTKRSQRASLGGSISRIRKALKEPSWAEADRRRLANELDDLLTSAKRIDQETAALSQHLRLLKLKRRLLRL